MAAKAKKSRTVRWREMLPRLDGFQIDLKVIKVSFKAGAKNLEKSIARTVLRYLEDRRVLFRPFDLEDPHYCVASVFEIRTFLTDAIAQAGESNIERILRRMRDGSREFIEASENRAFVNQLAFFTGLGDLRRTIGFYLALMCAIYELDVDGELTSILPPAAGE